VQAVRLQSCSSKPVSQQPLSSALRPRRIDPPTNLTIFDYQLVGGFLTRRGPLWRSGVRTLSRLVHRSALCPRQPTREALDGLQQQDLP
jgi:hypothetical protein